MSKKVTSLREKTHNMIQSQITHRVVVVLVIFTKYLDQFVLF